MWSLWKAFSWVSSYSNHKKIHHEEKAYECNVCGKSFKQNSTFSQHKNIHKEKLYWCKHCMKSFIWKSLLWNTREHTWERNPTSVYCVKRLLPRKQMPSIMRESMLVWALASVISATGLLSRRKTLLNIKKIYSEEKSDGCKRCGKVFTVKSNLRVHQKIHSGEKAYVCNECGKSFSQKEHLDFHKKLHTGQKPYKCSECGKAFAYKSYLDGHQKRIHTS